MDLVYSLLAKVGGLPGIVIGLLVFLIYKTHERHSKDNEFLAHSITRAHSEDLEGLRKEIRGLRDTLEEGFADENDALRSLSQSFGELSALQLLRLQQGAKDNLPDSSTDGKDEA